MLLVPQGAIRLSSLTFQRWTTCVMSFCLAWLCISLVQWLSTTPQTLQIVQVRFFFFIFLLVVVSNHFGTGSHSVLLTFLPSLIDLIGFDWVFLPSFIAL